MKIHTTSHDDMLTAAEKILGNFHKEEIKNRDDATILGLIGELGSGKTTFTQGLAKTLGVAEKITSPTFVLEKFYKTNDAAQKKYGFETLVHADLYRVDSENELEQLKFDEAFANPDNIVVIEWADKFRDELPDSTNYLEFMVVGENERDIRVHYA